MCLRHPKKPITRDLHIMFLRTLLITLLVAAVAGCATDQSDSFFQTSDSTYSIASPSGEIAVHFSLDDAGAPGYSIIRNGETVLLPSAMGITYGDERFDSGLTLAEVSPVTTHEESYSLLHGKRLENHYLAQEQVFTLKNADGNVLEIVFRVSDDGVAFRYGLPGASATAKPLSEEQTEFAFDSQARAWLQKVAVAQTGWSNTNPSYEEHYTMDMPVGTPSPSPAGWIFPALFKTGDTWLAITEAGLAMDHHASRLQAESVGGVYRIGQPMAAEVKTGGALLGASARPYVLPWRMIAVGDLDTLFQSTLGTDLALPTKIDDTDFIEPGVASWSWALLHDDGVTEQHIRDYIDYAATMGWQYTLIDVNWNKTMGYQKIAELVRYAAAKKVGLLLWYNSSGDWNITEYEPKSQLLTRESRRKEFARLQAMGIKGIKVDFFAGDGASMVTYYQDILTDAADFGLMVNCHGSTLPRGLQRTYPNLMTMESVHGFEMITFMQESADLAPAHMAMLPFTRNLFDPMDFTPTTFSGLPNIQRRTRNGFEIALPVLFLSGIQHIAEGPARMAATPDYVQAFMKDLPVAWDESRLLFGEPGHLVAVARRRGNDWFVAAINADEKGRELKLDLSFMGERQGVLIGDGALAKIDDPNNFSQRTVTSSEPLALKLKPRGGFVARF